MNRATVINIIALPILVFAAFTGMFWIWGCLFLWWALQSYSIGMAHLVMPIDREETPVLFWVVLLMWAGSGLAMIAASLFPAYAPYLV